MATKQIKTVGSKVHHNFGKSCLKFCSYLGNLTAVAGLAYKPVIVQACVPAYGCATGGDQPPKPRSTGESRTESTTTTKSELGVFGRILRRLYSSKPLDALHRAHSERAVATDLGALAFHSSYHRSSSEKAS